jgi:hypothetical protein
MPKEPRDRQQHGGHGGQPAQQHHGSTAEETAAMNETLKSFAEDYNKHNEEAGHRERIQFRMEVGLALGVGLNIALTVGLLIAGILQARYSGDQLTTMQDTERRQLRAYIGIAPGDVEDFGVSGKQRVHLTRKNYGSTPAYDVGFSAVGTQIIKIGGTINVAPNLCAQPNVFPGIAGLVTIFPSQEMPLNIILSDMAPAQESELVRSGESQFVYFGDVCYHDAFGAPHYTNYCYMYKGTDMTAKTADGCLQHNDSN